MRQVTPKHVGGVQTLKFLVEVKDVGHICVLNVSHGNEETNHLVPRLGH